MKKLFQTLLTPVLFRTINQKFIKIEIQFIAWSIACFFMAYRSGETVEAGFPDTFGEVMRTLVFAIPFAFMVFLVIRAWIKPSFYTLFDIPKEWWITRLNLSQQRWFTMTPKEVVLQDQLYKRFEDTYKIAYKDIKPHWLHIVQIAILFFFALLGFFLGK